MQGSFDRWLRDWGNRDARWAAKQGPGWFTASNLWVYENGSIGPRPGLKAYTLTSAPNGVVRGIDYQPTDKLAFVIGGSLYHFDPNDMTSQAVVTATGSIADTSSPLAFGSYVNDITYLTVRTDKSYTWNSTTDTVAAISSSPGGRCMVRHEDRYYVGDTANATSERVNYSDAADFATWGAADYFDVDYQFNVYELMPGSSRLAIHSDQNLWILTGTVGSTSQLRKVQRNSGRGIMQAARTIVNIADVFWFVTSYQYSIGWSNGAMYDVATYDMLRLPGTGKMYVSYGRPNCMAIADSADEALVMGNDVWTRWAIGVSVDSKASRWAERYMVVAADGDGSTPPTFYCIDFGIDDRPAFTSDTYASVGDDSTTPEPMTLGTACVEAPAGTEIQVRKVIVDFTKWATGSASTNHFDIWVRTHARYHADGTTDSTVLSWDEAGTSTTTSGEDERAEFSFLCERGAAFQVMLDDIRGVAIRAIHYVADESPELVP